MYNANIQENKVYGIILKEAKLFDDNINYQSSGNIDRGNKVLILNENAEEEFIGVVFKDNDASCTFSMSILDFDL